MSEPMVSVLMTAFNREAYIAEAIESVLTSTYTNFELIIVDDGSTDATVTIAKKYAAADGRIKVYVNAVNLGDYPNRNKAASYATGKYLKYLDSDDLIYPHGLRAMVDAMEKFPSAGLGLPYFKAEDNQPYPYLVDPESAYKEFFFDRNFLVTGPTGAIIKKSLFDEVGGFSGKRFVGDNEMWLTLAARQPVVKFQPALFWWRQHETQEFKKGQTIDGYYTLSFLTFKSLVENERCPLNEADKKKVIANLTRRQSRLIINLLFKQRELKNAFGVMEKCNFSSVDVVRNSFFSGKN